MSGQEQCQMEYHGPERRRCPWASEEAIHAIAERAATLAVEKITAQTYQAIGKSLVSRALWAIGAIGAGAALWANWTPGGK